jgi:hypothetical protein
MCLTLVSSRVFEKLRRRTGGSRHAGGGEEGERSPRRECAMTIGATMKRMIRPTAATGVTRDPVFFRWTGEFADAALEEKFLRANLNDRSSFW